MFFTAVAAHGDRVGKEPEIGIGRAGAKHGKLVSVRKCQ